MTSDMARPSSSALSCPSLFRRIEVNIKPDRHMPVRQHAARRSGESKPTILCLKEQPAEEVHVADLVQPVPHAEVRGQPLQKHSDPIFDIAITTSVRIYRK